MRAYSEDLRERVVRAVDQGKARGEIVRMLGVSLATIKRYLKQRRERGDLKAKRSPGRPPKKVGALQAGLGVQLQAHPDARLEDHCQLWEQAHGVRVSTTTMSRAIKRLGWTRKKSRWQQASAMKRLEPRGASR